MSATMATPLVNGFATAAADNVNEIQEYEKILRLRDEIFAGTHPRLTVPAHAIRKVSPLPVVNNNVAQPSIPTTQQSHLPGLSMSADDGNKMNIEPAVNKHSTVGQVKPMTSSGIDPVLLMKSDGLVKAETQLHRQRLEKALRDQFEQKRLDARKRPAAGEAKPDFDVAAVLTRAQEVAKPEGVTTPKEDASNSDEYDANSLYSSRAPDSTPEVGELDGSAPSQNQNQAGISFGANDPAEIQPRAVPNSTTLVAPPQTGSPSTIRRPSGPGYTSAVDNDDDEEEEGEYSPPEAVERFAATGDPNLQQMVDPRSRPLRRYSELDENGKGLSSPNDNVRIVRNHILNPVAPQPSRVSPLAVAKDPLISQNPRTRNGRPNQRARAGSPRQSPDGSGPGLHPRKKRKVEKKLERRRRNGAGSPDVKDEPVSPPPFHDVQPLGSGRPRPTAGDRPIIIDDGPVREARYIPAPDPYLSSPSRPLSRQADPILPMSEPRVVSRSGIRPLRDDTDLRRVASMHNMRSELPRRYVEEIYDSPTRARATSYVQVDSPARMEPPRLVQDIPPTYEREANQAVRITRSPASAYREVYHGQEPEVRYIPEPMPPTTIERIVIDQYGRRFREIIQERPSVAPRAYSTIPDGGQAGYYESYERDRGQSVMMDARVRDDLRPGEMAPPPIVRPVADTGKGYREVYEALPPQRSGSVRPVESLPRQPVYLDERPEYRAPIREGSYRPTSTRYEEMPPPPSMTARATSIRPSGREGSVFIDDRQPVRREYLPVEAPRYRAVEPETRYVDAQGGEITYVDSAQDGGPRYVQRY